MRCLAPIVSFSFLLFSGTALAAPRCVVFSSQAQGTNGTLVPLEVASGHGLNINFIPTGETITKVWIDDSSKVGVSFDGNLCQWKNSQQAQCKSSLVTVIHLRQTELIKIPDLPRSKSGSTLLSAVASGADGRKLYQFTVSPISKSPACSSITIVPDPPQLEAVVPNPPIRSSQVNSAINRIEPHSNLAISDADAALRGLARAMQNRQIAFNSTLSQKTHRAIKLLQQGMSQEAAANRANIPFAFLSQLIAWGQQ
jgi:hypothetical protein